MSGMKPEDIVSLFIIYTLAVFIGGMWLFFNYDRTLVWWPLLYLVGCGVFFKLMKRR